eukprot:16431141-Heterocapsa_arctica.AAC.1
MPLEVAGLEKVWEQEVTRIDKNKSGQGQRQARKGGRWPLWSPSSRNWVGRKEDPTGGSLTARSSTSGLLRPSSLSKWPSKKPRKTSGRR